MNPLRTALYFVLIAALLEAQPPSVRALLSKPRLGVVRLTRNDGTVLDGRLVRVTNQFVTFQSKATCENVELPSIAAIKAIKTKEPFKMADAGGGIAWWLLSPVWLFAWLLSLSPDNHDPALGIWEPVFAPLDGSVTRIQIGSRIRRKRMLIRKGRYQIQGQKLLLKFEPFQEGTSSEQTLPFRFECTRLALDGQWLTVASAQLRPASAPIVARWHDARWYDTISKTEAELLAWEFRPDGTFQRETFTQSDQEDGVFLRQGDGIHVQFRGNSRPDHEEDWKIRAKSGHLWITRDGGTTEYKHVTDF